FLVRFEFTGPSLAGRCQRHWWLLVRDGEVEVCAKEPFPDADAVVVADIASFVNVWMGYERVSDALAGRRLSLAGGSAPEGGGQAPAEAVRPAAGTPVRGFAVNPHRSTLEPHRKADPMNDIAATDRFVLHGLAESGNCYKVALMLDLCGIDWEARSVDFFDP